MRVFQGIGAGGLAALSQIVMADIISPRERGRYAGLFGAVMAVATVGGPLLGGVITDTLGWRWNFFVGLPIAIVALVLLQRTLHLPKRPKTKVTDRLPRHRAHLGRRLAAAALGHLRRQASSSGSPCRACLMVGGAVAAAR